MKTNRLTLLTVSSIFTVAAGAAISFAVIDSTNEEHLVKDTNGIYNLSVEKTNPAPIKLQLPTDLISKTDTNAVMSLPVVQQLATAAFAQGVQFGVMAALQNQTLVQMQDADGLHKAALFLKFGAPKR